MSEKTAEEWGRLAMSLPGWQFTPGAGGWHKWPGKHGAREWARVKSKGWSPANDELGTVWVPDPDDPATEGCLLRLLGPWVRQVLPPRWEGESWRIFWQDPSGQTTAKDWASGANLGRACIAAAASIGEWPGGAL